MTGSTSDSGYDAKVLGLLRQEFAETQEPAGGFISDRLADIFSLIESIPEGMTYPNGTASYPSTYETWYDLIDKAQHTIEIASFYWTLRQDEVYPDPSSGEEIYNALLTAGLDKNIKIKIAQNAPSLDQPNTDTESLGKKGAAQVRSLNFAKLIGSGVLHTKLWLVDRKHFYIGSANMDWRALTQVKEMGIVGYNCSCLADDIGKIFDVYWQLGEKGAKIPDHWPYELHTKYNNNTPMNVITNTSSYQVYVSRRFIVPATKEQKQIPFARVNHNKYMVTESTAYIGTSNWSGDYFINTAGVAFVLQDGAGVKNDTVTIRSQLQSVFERDWNSNYSYPIEVLL
ncbi:phospholipase d - related [Holotrichia oblita]|uniref:Phospholipase d - related n=1 Tax=Holotrichia oblita TaxID=644536 RepID=A0ACB9SRX3_HOLOL|nr:phospholipase d - related [Holotrichia oblita]